MRLPPEVLYTTAVEYLDCQTVVSLSMTCRDLHTLLNTSQTLWKSLTYRKTGINYIHQGGNWRQACFDPEFHEQCPHLSSLTFDQVLADRIQRFHQVLESQPFEEIECTISNCEIKTPDLWMCLTKGCDHVGCGRTKNQHAIDHFLSSNHPLCVKINTLEFWCYKCTKWMGKQNLYPAETQLTERIISSFLKPNTYPYQFLKTHFAAWNKRRYIERGMYKIVESDKLYFLSRDFLMRWREFLLSNQGPPECIDNWSLVGNADAVREHGQVVEMNPNAVPLQDFGIISEKNWVVLFGFYGGGPVLSTDTIPATDPRYKAFLKRLETVKGEIVRQCEVEARQEQLIKTKNQRTNTKDNKCHSENKISSYLDATAVFSAQDVVKEEEENELDHVHSPVHDIRVLETLLYRGEQGASTATCDGESGVCEGEVYSSNSGSSSRALYHPAAPLQ